MHFAWPQEHFPPLFVSFLQGELGSGRLSNRGPKGAATSVDSTSSLSSVYAVERRDGDPAPCFLVAVCAANLPPKAFTWKARFLRDFA